MLSESGRYREALYLNDTSVAASVSVRVIDARCGHNNSKVLICKSGHTLCVANLAIPILLANGGTLGACEDDPGSHQPSRMTVFPNPVFATSKLILRMGKASPYTLAVYNLSGKLVKTIGQGQAMAGSVITYDLRAGDYRTGIYFIKLVTDTEVLTEKVIIF